MWIKYLSKKFDSNINTIKMFIRQNMIGNDCKPVVFPKF